MSADNSSFSSTGGSQPVQQPLPLAFVNGEALIEKPEDLYIPPDALELILDAFEGPLDLLLYLIRRQNMDILTIDVSDETSYMAMLSFLNIDRNKAREGGFKQINIGGKVRAWQHLNNTFKVESTHNGRIDKILY